MSKKTLSNRLESLFQELDQEQISLTEGKDAAAKGAEAKKTTPPAKRKTPAKGRVPAKQAAPDKEVAAVQPIPTLPRPEIEPFPVSKLGEAQISPLSRSVPESLPLQPTYHHATQIKPALMNVPFRMPDQKMGIMEIEDDTENRFWNEDERRLVEQVTDQVSLALENAYLSWLGNLL
jgi:GAF domain-containing protein